MIHKKLKILLLEKDNIEAVKLKSAISEKFDDYEITVACKINEALSILENNFIVVQLLQVVY